MGLVYQLFSRNILWVPFKIVSYFIFFNIILFSIFKPSVGVLLIFSYIALWSRIPCLVSDWTKDLDMIDFFAVIIALNLHTSLSGVYAGIFSVGIMMFSRLFGPDEDIVITITESIAFFAASVFTPGVYLTTNNLLITMFVFTGIRYLVDMIIITIYLRHLFFLGVVSIFFGVPIAYIMNKTMIIVLGPFFSTVFESGLNFNFPLFLLALILTVSVHYLTKYMTKNDYIIETKIYDKNKSVGNISNDNMMRYPEFY